MKKRIQQGEDHHRKEERVGEIDWLGTPIESLLSVTHKLADGTAINEMYDHEYTLAQLTIAKLYEDMVWHYGTLVPEEDKDRFETKGEVPLLGEDRKVYVLLEDLTLRDLPAILYTIVVLEEDHWRREREEAEREAAARKARERDSKCEKPPRYRRGLLDTTEMD
jgi:hypothetical protein